MNDKIFLLSIEEAKKLPKCILRTRCEYWYWLRTCGYGALDVEVVYRNGNIDSEGREIVINFGSVRPAIRFDFQNEIERLPRTERGYVIYLGKKWIDISDCIGFPCLLKKNPFGTKSQFDFTSNDYETSKIRKWLLDWHKKKVKEITK